MKIAFFTENSYAGGLDSFLITLINHWPYDEDQLTLICNRSHPGLEVIRRRTKRSLRIIAHDIPMQWEWVGRLARIPVLGRLRKVVSPLCRYPFFLLYVAAVRRILRREAPDRVMVVNGGYPGGDSNRAAAIAWDSVRGSRPPSVHNVHNLAIVPRWWERIIENMIDARVALSTLAFVSVSRACINSLNNRPSLRKGERFEVIYNGVPEVTSTATPQSTAKLRESLKVPLGAPMCLMLGTFEPRKGHGFLFRAFHRVLDAVPSARLVVCGFGTDQDTQNLHALLAAEGLGDKVEIAGFRDDVPDLLTAADVLVVPSQAFESFGLMMVEAMSQRVPIVATNVGGLPEVMGGDAGGYCVAADNDALFAEKVIEFLNDEALRRETGERGYQRYRQLFTAERMSGEYAEILHAE